MAARIPVLGDALSAISWAGDGPAPAALEDGRPAVLDDCGECGSGEWHPEMGEGFSVGVPRLANLGQFVVRHCCSGCGARLPRFQARTFLDGPPFGAEVLAPNPARSPADGIELVSLSRNTPNSRVFFQYPGVRVQDGWEVVPVTEPTIQDATTIDRHGDPDLMADFADEYLDQFEKLLPSGRLPDNLPPLMPALLLLVTSAELAIKAFHIRSGGPQPQSHSLTGLHSSLRAEHRDEAQRRFAASPVAAKLSEAGGHPPTIEGILGQYAATYDASSGVYTDCRYYAEPTTMLKSENLKGTNLVKASTPYPVFLPEIARALIDTFRNTTGAERLKRRGAAISDDIGGPGDGNHNHGKWRLIPSTLGLAAVVVAQNNSIGPDNEDLPAFREFKEQHPTPLALDWMHGGQRLLFYRAEPADPRDGTEVIGGLECRVVCDHAVGMHSRDLWLLAEQLDAPGGDGLGALPPRQ